MVKKILTIAGSDSLSGGGLQTDLATFTTMGMAGFAVISSIVLIKDNKVRIDPVPIDIFQAQLDSVEQVERFSAIKVGLLQSPEQIEVVANFLKDFIGPVVIDPVLSFKEGKTELNHDVLKAYREKLLPLATVVTPNLKEGMLLLNDEKREAPKSRNGVLVMASDLSHLLRCSVYLKAGKGIQEGQYTDVLIDESNHGVVLHYDALDDAFNHGSGCVLAASMACFLADNMDLKEASRAAADFTRHAIVHSYSLKRHAEDGNAFPNWRVQTWN
ncbi:hydroxymethylpyrimidine/phosphomethylpyrimidine kinase [Fructobacillus sp. M2-14]|uniref:pyridoxal kinase n=1 Tax=Fructobacillus broussonetiae TaxID=2713173 RepID=A0ABS5R156_9LACO|nr:hydroxymethylpyrimidine/phosphomethylpyrimidine kinase [Fructobacillus broussonetiae]MBS9338234.1 hydroxymethylpyrimidine/phosphomethylpyrimidine kinase [Fructobacillus broussonetiae]